MTYARDVVVVADGFLQQTVTNLPGEDGRTFALKLRYFADHVIGGDARFGTADGSRPD